MRVQLGAFLCTAALGLCLASVPLSAQARSEDVSSKLARVLPDGTADQILRRIDDARARGLPAAALAAHALELSAKGVAPDRVAQAVDDQAGWLEAGRAALTAGGRENAREDEIDAAATALSKGVDGRALSDLARLAPSSRSLALPLLVISSLVDRGLPADYALRQVLARVEARASDQQLERLADARSVIGTQAPASLNAKDLAASRRPDLGRPGLVPTGAVITGNRPMATPPRPPGVAKP